jgi:3-hydroxyisobutyrate dehydrogenase
MKPVGFIGLGQMGKPMARQLADWPGGLIVHDARPEAMTKFAEHGATAAASPREVAETAGVISVMVLDDDQVEQVVTGPAGLLETAGPGTVIAIHSTVRQATVARLAELTAQEGIHVVDAPVSGGAMAARNGSLAVMVGATDEAFQRCREPFEKWAGLVMHAGPPGAGTAAKLARNLLHFAAFTAAGEAARLAEAAGIDLVELGRVVRHSDSITGGPGAIMLRPTAAPVEPDDNWYPILSHVRGLGTKDLSLAIELGEVLGVELPLARLALDRLAGELGVPTPTEEDA